MSRDELRRLLRAMEEDPEARDEVRRAVLTEELLALPQRVAELDARLTARLDQLAGTVAELDARLTARLDQLAGTVAELDARLTELTVRVDQLAVRVDQLAVRVDQLTGALELLSGIVSGHGDKLGRLEGETYALRFERVAPGRLMRLPLRRIRPVVGDRRYGLADDAVEAGRVSVEEAADLQEVDLVVRGRLTEGVEGTEAAEAYAVVEVSVGIGHGDADRAVRRAQVLARASGLPVLAVVAGERVAVARIRDDVWVVLDGQVWKPGEHPGPESRS